MGKINEENKQLVLSKVMEMIVQDNVNIKNTSDLIMEIAGYLEDANDQTPKCILELMRDCVLDNHITSNFVLLLIIRGCPLVFGDSFLYFLPILKHVLIRLPTRDPVILRARNETSVGPLGISVDLLSLVRNTFTENMSNCLQACTSIGLDATKGETARQNAIEVIVSYIESAPKSLEEHAPNSLSHIVELCLTLMSEMDDDMLEDWLNDSDEDEDLEEMPVIGESAIDRIACAMNGKTLFPLNVVAKNALKKISIAVKPLQIVTAVFTISNQFLAFPCWKKQVSAIRAIAVISRIHPNDIKPQIGEVFNTIAQFIKEDHPRVRLATCDAICQIFADFAPILIKKCHAQVYPVLLKCLENTDSPRICGKIISSVRRLMETTGADTRYDSMVCASLEFLSMVSQRQYYESHFTGEGVLKTLTENVCVQNLLLRQKDIELFKDEPVDYMKRDIEGTDVGTRRRGAIDLARALCRRYEAQMMPCLSEIVQTLLASNDWIKIDIVYSLITAIAVKSETARGGVTATNPVININDFFIGQVATHLNADVNQLPILKADALKFSVTFRNQLAPEHLLTTIRAADALLSSNTPILHKYAAYAIDKILSKNSNRVFSAQNLPVASILQNLVSAFDKDPKAQNSPYLIKAILRVIVILDDETIPHADAIATKLGELVASATKNPVDSVHKHFLFETICVLVSKTKTIGESLDAQLLPLIEVIFSEDIEDLIPYALQITGVLVSSCISRQSSIDSYFNFLPFLLSERLWARSANVPAALSVLEVLLTVNPQKVFAEHSQAICDHMARLLGSKVLDQHGFQLASAVIPVIEHLQHNDPYRFVLNNMFRRVKTTKTPKFMKLFVVFLCKLAILIGAHDLVTVCDSVQAGMFTMLMEKVVICEMPALKNLTTMPEKQIIAIGTANILGEATNVVAPFYGDLALEVASLLEAASASDRAVLSPDEEQEAMYNAEGEFVNPFCRLSYAPKSAQIIPKITNHKAYFAQAVLIRGPSNNQAVLSCVPQETINYLSTIQE